MEPLHHPALESFAVLRGGRLHLAVRERRGGRPAATAVHPPGDDPHAEPVAQIRAWPLQWQSLEVDGAAVELEAGHWGTAPLFLQEDRDALRGHWDAAALMAHVRRSSLDPERAARWIRDYATPYSTSTLFDDLRLLPERTAFRCDGTASQPPGPAISAPAPWPRPQPGTPRDDADPLEALGSILQASISRWAAIAGDGFAREVSGGLDSCLVTAAASTRRELAPRSYGIALLNTPEAERDQRERREEIIARFALTDRTVRMQDHLPLAPASGRLGGALPRLPWEEGYYETMDALLALASQDGTRVMSTGFGGDELFGLRPSERAACGLPPHGEDGGQGFEPSFLTSRTRDLLRAPPPRMPRGACSASALEAAAFSAARYIRHGIWPVHPLCTPELVHFCARLPPGLRRARRIQRDFLTRAGLSIRVTRPRQRDDFSPAMAQSMRHDAFPLLTRLFRSPALADLGIVDAAALRRDYAAWRESGGSAGATVFYATAILELAMQ